MTLMTCAAVRRRLPAFHDRELPIGELIAIESHLHDCPPCSRDLRDLQSIGNALRAAAAPAPPDDWTGVRPGVISRMRAEAAESWTARVRRAFDDLHLVWIALASTAGTFVCAGTVLSMLHFGPSPERQDSLAAVIAVKAAPYGSDVTAARLDARFSIPSVPENGVVYATLILPRSPIVTREGRVSGLEVLNKNGEYDPQTVAEIMAALSHSRLEPAQFGGSPVAVNLVWLVAHTTVKGKISS
jgi:hypothetical protein